MFPKLLARVEHVCYPNANMEPIRCRPAVSNFAKDNKLRLQYLYFQLRSLGRLRFQMNTQSGTRDVENQSAFAYDCLREYLDFRRVARWITGVSPPLDYGYFFVCDSHHFAGC